MSNAALDAIDGLRAGARRSSLETRMTLFFVGFTALLAAERGHADTVARPPRERLLEIVVERAVIVAHPRSKPTYDAYLQAAKALRFNAPPEAADYFARKAALYATTGLVPRLPQLDATFLAAQPEDTRIKLLSAFELLTAELTCGQGLVPSAELMSRVIEFEKLHVYVTLGLWTDPSRSLRGMLPARASAALACQERLLPAAVPGSTIDWDSGAVVKAVGGSGLAPATQATIESGAATYAIRVQNLADGYDPCAVHVLQRTFYFANASSDATSNDVWSKKAVAAIADELRLGERTAVVIEAHADGNGPHWYNDPLAKARAELIWKALVDAGIPASRMRAVTLSDACPQRFVAADAMVAENRRVTVKVVPR